MLRYLELNILSSLFDKVLRYLLYFKHLDVLFNHLMVLEEHFRLKKDIGELPIQPQLELLIQLLLIDLL